MNDDTVQKILVTGGAGFIGSNLIRLILDETDYEVMNFDKLTYAGNLESLNDIKDNPKYHFTQGDIGKAKDVDEVFERFKPDWVMNLAAESHVDRSIDGPEEFIQTNIVGTFHLLRCARERFNQLDAEGKARFRQTKPHLPR